MPKNKLTRQQVIEAKALIRRASQGVEQVPKQNSSKDTSSKDRDRENGQKGWREVAPWALSLGIGFFLTFVSVMYSSHRGLAIWALAGALIAYLACVLLLLEWNVALEKKRRRQLRRSFSLLCAAIVVAGGVLQYKTVKQPSPPLRPWLRLTDDERRNFIEVLASQTAPREHVRIGCPAANEDICVLATPFIDAFKRGHFIVENDRVDRLALSRPAAGVVLFKYGHADAFDPQDPNQGKWVEQTTSLETLEEAFGEIGINSRTTADESSPKDVIGVYFGIEPFEPVERENIRKIKQDVEKQLGQTPKP